MIQLTKTGEVIKEKKRFWFVNDCPKDADEIRVWKGGKYKGKKYVKLAYCLNCPYNLTDGLVEEIEFDDDYEENTFYQKTVENKMPFYKVGKKLKCCGHLHQSIHKDPQIPIIKLLKKTHF